MRLAVVVVGGALAALAALLAAGCTRFGFSKAADGVTETDAALDQRREARLPELPVDLPRDQRVERPADAPLLDRGHDLSPPDAHPDKAVPDKAVPDKAVPDKAVPDKAVPDASGQVCVGGPTVLAMNLSARRVIGQADFVGSSVNRGGSAGRNTMYNPVGIAVHSGKIYVADAGNNRILVYHGVPATDGADADEVIGQPDFTTTTGVAGPASLNGGQGLYVDASHIVVGEWGNSRVSFWPTASSGMATIFWGQPDGTSAVTNNGGLSDRSLTAAPFVQRLGGYYLVSDAGNNRVLMFDASPTALVTFQHAARVIGQPDFVSSVQGTATNQIGTPLGIATDGTRLAIIDNHSDRLMIYNTLPTTNGAAADVIWGGWGVSATQLNSPVGVHSDGTRLFIADRGSDRVLVFNTWPTSATQPADLALGQAVFTSSDHNQCSCAVAKPNSLWGAHGVVWDGCRLLVTDTQNNRVVVY